MLVLLFCTWIFGCYAFHKRQYSTFHGTSNRGDYRTVQWNSSGPVIHLTMDAFFPFIDHGVNSDSLFENVFMCFMNYFFCYCKRHSIIQNLFQLSIFKTEHSSSEIWDCQWRKMFSVTSVFTALILLLLLQIIKMCQCCGFTFINFFFMWKQKNNIFTTILFVFDFLNTAAEIFWWNYESTC